MASEKEELYKKALVGKKFSVLTLDHKWHHLFKNIEPDATLKELEEKLNTLLRRQGKLNTESKDIKKIKKKLMDEIVGLMEQEDTGSQKQIEENRRLINECNEKLEGYQDELLELPQEINVANYDLMVRTMEICYDVLQQNTDDIQQIADWITQIRIELKKNIVRKQEMEIKNHELYSYMHDIFGADVIEIFDMKYNPLDNPIGGNKG